MHFDTFWKLSGRTIAIAGIALLAWTLLPTTMAESAPDDWPQFRGYGSSGASTQVGLFEAPVGVGLRVAWKKPLGSGYSSVAVSLGRAVTMFSEGESDVLAAYDTISGEEIWRHVIGEIYPGHDGSHDGPVSTPLIAGDHVVALTPRGKLFSVKTSTGKPVWSVDITEKFGVSPPSYGFGMSPVLADGAVVLQLGAEDAAVASFDVATGERLWGAGSDGAAYQTPGVMEFDGSPLLLAAGGQKIYGVRPRTGEVVWEYEHEGGGGGYGSGKLTPLPAGPGRLFLQHKSDNSKMVRMTTTDGDVAFETLWENRNIRHSYDTPVYHDGYLYAYSARFLTCLDAETGETRWRSREPGDGFLMLVDGHLVIVTKNGSVHVARADPNGYKELAGLEVFEEHAWSPPSFANGHIFVRSLGEIARVDVTGGTTLGGVERRPMINLDGTKFGKFLAKVGKSHDKSATVDRFMEQAKSFPIIEGKNLVHFVYRGAADDVAVSGDLSGVSAEFPMTRVEGTDLFYWSTRLEPDARINYLIIPDYDEGLDPLNPRKTSTTVFSDDMELSFSGQPYEMSWFSMPEWREPAFLESVDEERQGWTESKEVASEILGAPLPVVVYVPADYDDDDRRYPVIYVHGGQLAREQGDWTTALDNLIGRKIEPVIVVFIGQAQAPFSKVAEMFPKELVPWVDSNYRSIPEAAARANVGQGFGGVSAFFCTFAAPGVVGKLATQSAFLLDFAWGPLQPLIESFGDERLDFYIDWGKYDMRSTHENWDLSKTNQELASYFRDQGHNVSGGEANDGSGWPSWRNRTDALLESMFARQ